MDSKAMKIGNVTGIISVIIFIICMGWGLLMTSSYLKEFHAGLIRVIYPGYNFTVFGILLGLIEAYIYGWLIGVGFVWICKKLCIKE